MAIGTDAVAHKTVLKYGGKTIAVLGSGFNHIYPKENTELFYEILENDGLIITEYEKNIEPYKRNFPARNRIITAISEGVLVIEAAYRSGTSITANNAKDQGKKVFALPGKLDSYLGIGVNKLIKEGAILTTNINDIIKTRELVFNLSDKSVSKYRDGKLIKTYPTVSKACKENNISSSELKHKIKEKTGEWAYGYSETYNPKFSEPITLMIDQYDMDDNLIKTWNSYSECRKEHPNVKQVLCGGRKQTHGYTFKIHKLS